MTIPSLGITENKPLFGAHIPEEVAPFRVKKLNLNLRPTKKVNADLNEAQLKMFDTIDEMRIS